jgi:hypothetical protein
MWLKHIEGNICEAVHGQNVNRFPDALRVGNSMPSVRLKKPSRPVRVRVVLWRRVDRKGRPAGERESVPHMLRPYFREGQMVGWEVVLTLPDTPRHVYLQTTAHWRDEEGCHEFAPDLGSQWGKWRFHLKRRGG